MTRRILLPFLVLFILGSAFVYCLSEEKKPLSIEDIEDLLRNFVSGKRIVDLIKDYGVRFEKTEENIEKMKKIGADESIFAAVEKEWSKNNRILTIETDPVNATVYLDGIKRGQTPIKLEGLKPGEYTLRIEKEGYLGQEHNVSLTESLGKKIEANLKKKDLGAPEHKPKIEKPKPRHVEMKLNYSIFFPAPHKHTVLATEWAGEIEKKTNGMVKISMFPGGTLTRADKCYDGVVKGISDIGMSVFAYSRGNFPLTEVIDLPLGYKSGWAATNLINEYFKRFKPKELDAVKVMYLHAHGPGILHTRKAVNKPEDLRGMKIRSTGMSAKIIAALGGVPVAMPMGETYDALRRGVVEGFMAPQEALYGWKLGEVAKYTVETFGSGYSTGFYVVMNKDKWNALSSDTQKIIEEVNEEWIEKTGRLWDEIDKVGRDFTLKLDNRIISLSNEENERWAKAVRPLLDEYVHSMKTKGIPGDEALKFCLNHLKQIPLAVAHEITFDVPYGKVKFTHMNHIDKVKLECTKCHHTWKKGETSGRMCKDCHKAKTEGKIPSAKDAFHKECKKCHDEAKKANKPAGPTGCTHCHVKLRSFSTFEPQTNAVKGVLGTSVGDVGYKTTWHREYC